MADPSDECEPPLFMFASIRRLRRLPVCREVDVDHAELHSSSGSLLERFSEWPVPRQLFTSYISSPAELRRSFFFSPAFERPRDGPAKPSPWMRRPFRPAEVNRFEKRRSSSPAGVPFA